jgi:hypothetical protein
LCPSRASIIAAHNPIMPPPQTTILLMLHLPLR